MSSYDKSYQVRETEGMRIQSECNVRNRLNLSVGDTLPYKQVEVEYSRLLESKINKDKCKRTRKHI